MAVLFNGGYQECSAILFPQAQSVKSICFWANFSEVSSLQTVINFVNPTTAVGYQIGLSSGNLIVWGYGGSALIQAVAPPLNTWVFITYIYTGSQHQVYYNAVLSNSSNTASQSGQPSLCQLGGNQWSENLINAELEDVRLYNRVLSVNEIYTIMTSNTMDNIKYGLVGAWPLSAYKVGLTFNQSNTLKETQSGIYLSAVNSNAVARQGAKLQRRRM